ncbi:glycosyltransferase, group 2 family protein [Aeromicrobium marinum DSM 15272]|uniref:Glycosyltransferase, group 2 family protein n=1 Tax=Aeromicrobium marinum DSM 15272 TaxID=585531 RepID=E2SB62_9ACTN|nr:glycosyltransferase [Aeromicrobium marinum]EFQ83608.1 glycosyltransferase, group 2 family protein [Aeromicrobium marinum DSM 15272]
MTGPARPTRVAAVVVSYNRGPLLAETLEALAAQTHRPAAVVVVDNASTDGSAEVAERDGVDLVRLEVNTGGAGGFATAMATALARHDPTWIWVMDDDVVPAPGALAALLAAADASATPVDALCSRAEWTDGREHPMNTPRPWALASRTARENASAAGGVAVRSVSFVSSIYRVSAVRERGLPIADYFIWNDDFEYSTRIIAGSLGLAVPASVVLHQTAALADTDADPGPRFYFEVRNKLWVFRHARGLLPREKAVFVLSTARRWIRTWRRSQDRAVIADGWRRGVGDARSRPPRPNAVVLAGAGVPPDVLDVVAELDRVQQAWEHGR